jgi:hypothetical protein
MIMEKWTKIRLFLYYQHTLSITNEKERSVTIA